MKRIKAYDIFIRPSPKLRKISVRRQGRWVFASIDASKFTREQRGTKFYLISEPFGLVRYDVQNPKKTAARGLAGDYISSDSEGNLTLVTAQDFKRKFPTPNLTVQYAPLTSENFKDRNYSQESSEGTATTNSNTSTNNLNSNGATYNARSRNPRTSY